MNHWWHQRRTYRWLFNYFKGKSVKLKSLRKACEQNNVPQPHEMTLERAREGIKRCTDKLNELCPTALAKRREHLTNRLNTARQQDNEKKVKEIERVMQREEGLQKWGRIGCATKKRRTKAASRCAV